MQSGGRMRSLRAVGFVLLAGCMPSFDCSGLFDVPDLARDSCAAGTSDGTRCHGDGTVCWLDDVHTCTCLDPTWSCDFRPDLSSPEPRD